MWNKLADLKWR
uniref:Uncharacterized protein n=1 Tax=Anguilla anguilla TaxID=7936 RepID=A0A0E9R4I5_ANGAN